jgi:hypothetical protein
MLCVIEDKRDEGIELVILLFIRTSYGVVIVGMRHSVAVFSLQSTTAANRRRSYKGSLMVPLCKEGAKCEEL